MGTLSGLTAQVNSMGGCTPADCCAKIAAIESQLAAINAEIAAIKAKPQKDHTADIGKIFALLGTLQIGLAGLGAEVGIIGGTVGGLGAVVSGLSGLIGAAAAEIAALKVAITGFLASLAALSRCSDIGRRCI